MAHYDEIGEFGFNELLARRLTTPGGSVAPTVAPELFPCVVLENDRPEYAHLKREQLCARFCYLSAVAAQYGMFQFYLPTTARSIAVITSIHTTNANTINIARAVGISGGLAGWAAVTTANRDTGENGEGGALKLESNNNVAQPTVYGVLASLTTNQTRFDAPMVVRPGGSIVIYQNVVNSITSCNVVWYERSAQPGELV